MAELWNKTQNRQILSQLDIATKFVDRGVGLLKYKKLEPSQGLWIHSCNSIHTLFMKFTIDCIFVDKNLVVRALHQKVKPWRMIIPQFGSSSVFELPEGAIEQNKLMKGDQLHVVS
jgi:uncharacterized membrane protein (UPF0127 family)